MGGARMSLFDINPDGRKRFYTKQFRQSAVTIYISGIWRRTFFWHLPIWFLTWGLMETV